MRKIISAAFLIGIAAIGIGVVGTVVGTHQAAQASECVSAQIHEGQNRDTANTLKGFGHCDGRGDNNMTGAPP